jgi:disulfide bond formation protein DsbB
MLIVLLASAGILCAALLFEYEGGLAPCELCLYERWPYYAAVTLAILALLTGNAAAMRGILALCCLLFAAGTALAFYHVGVEQHWFAGPTACVISATAGGDFRDERAAPHPSSARRPARGGRDRADDPRRPRRRVWRGPDLRRPARGARPRALRRSDPRHG